MSGTVVVVSPRSKEPIISNPAEVIEDILSGLALHTPDLNSPLLRSIDSGLLRVIKGGLTEAPQGYQGIKDLKGVLCHGTASPSSRKKVRPFEFDDTEGRSLAISAGLEGFLHTEAQIAEAKGAGKLIHQLEDYERYTCNLLSALPNTAAAQEVIHGIMRSGEPKLVQYAQLIHFLNHYTEALKQQVRESDQARWLRSANIYQIFPRIFNLKGNREANALSVDHLSGKFLRDMSDEDLVRCVTDQGADVLWLTGTFPIGLEGRKGAGSPYSITDHLAVNPELGTAEDLQQFVKRCHSLGIKVMLDLVPNHTSRDAELLKTHPEWYLHKEAVPGEEPPFGYFAHSYTERETGQQKNIWIQMAWAPDEHNRPYYYEDVAQLNLAYQDQDGSYPVQEYWKHVTSTLVEKFGVDGFRCDMIEATTNQIFNDKHKEFHVDMGPVEFLDDLIAHVKTRFPNVGFLGESYTKWNTLSQAGFDLIYGKNPVGPSLGWFDPWKKGSADQVAGAIARKIYLQNQVGGASVMIFPSDHDRLSAEEVFKGKLLRILMASRLLPGNLTYGGDETVGGKEHRAGGAFFDAEPADWTNMAPHYEEARHQALLAKEMGLTRAVPIPRRPGSPWAGFLLTPESHPLRRQGDYNASELPPLAALAVIVPLLDNGDGSGINGDPAVLRIPIFSEELGIRCAAKIEVDNPDSCFLLQIPYHDGEGWEWRESRRAF